MARGFDRRQVLLGLGAAGLAASVLRGTSADAEQHEAETPDVPAETSQVEGAVEAGEAVDAVEADEETGPAEGSGEGQVEYLFVQSAEKVVLSGSRLELRGVSPSTVYFSDRPERIAGHVPTTSFLNQWSKGKDSFRDDPPNATLSVLGTDEIEEVVVTLRSPMLKSGNLLYEVDVLQGPKQVTGGASSLFIDVIGRPMTPVSIAGHRRRVRRRVLR